MILRSAVPLAIAAVLAAGVVAGEARPPALPFIENDQASAFAKAKASARSVFVEVWAPW
jgi:hypothetical protein